MGVCLRGKMTDAGILPRQAVASTDAATPAAEPVAVVSPAPLGEPALDVTPEVPAALAPDSLIAATFGLLRAEPDGSVVIAGSGTPGSKVEIYSNGALLGTAIVEPSGDWVLVPDEPIIPGGTEITLAEAGKPGRAAQSFVVVINDDKSSEPLVVASTPGAASDILQGLDRPAIDTTIQLAAADPVTPPAPTPTPRATPTPVAVPTPAPPAPAAIETTAQAQTAAPAKPVTPPAPAAPAAKAVPAAAPATAPTPAPPTAPVATPATPAPAAGVTGLAAALPTPAPTAPAPAVAAATPVPAATPAPTAPAPVAVAPTIDAIEIEGDRTFFAGAGSEGATIRLYIDDSFIADSVVEDGRWLVEGGKVLTKPSQRVRIDMLAAGSAEVASRAEVNFDVELPADEAPTAVAEADPAATAAQAALAAPAETPATAPAVAEVPAASAAPVPAPVATDAPAADTVPTLVAVSVGGPDSERFASGKAIIRRGDNLWTIARRVYGEGIRYTTIYEANTGQIRDPDRIYPGQVFELPN